MKPRLPLAVAIITFNEAAHLPRCLASVRDLAAEIVVLDSGSTDATEEIARSHGARFHRQPWAGFIAQKNRALQHCTQPWVLNLDADEVVSPELADAIQARFARGSPAEDGFWLNRRTQYLGDWIWHAWYPDRVLRLVRRDKAVWGGMDPHARMDLSGPADQLEGDLLHYSFRDLHHHLTKTLGYARDMARSYAAQGRPFRWRHLLLSPFFDFFKVLVVKQAWRDGWRGWLIAVVRIVDVIAKYAYLLELQRRPNSPTADTPAGPGPKTNTGARRLGG